jgi:hypothetical protein
MTDEHPPSLAGDADPNSWYFKNPDQDGPLPNPVGHTFPLLTHDANGRWELIGTGFYACYRRRESAHRRRSLRW